MKTTILWIVSGLFLIGGVFLLGTADARAADTPLSDGQILKFTHNANGGEIAQAKLAKTKSKDAKVKKFAEAMITDHSDADKKGKALATKNKITLADSTEASGLAADAEKTSDDLKAASAGDFDKAYVDVQVKEHQAVLDALDNKLIPAAVNEDVKEYLKAVREKVSMHLQHAVELQATLAKAS